MKVTFWGVRGSIACSGPHVVAVGGNTSCVEVQAQNHRLILDGGTGLRGLGQHITQRQNPSTIIQADLLFSHLHWDHIQGFPFFAPAFAADSKLRLFGPTGDDGLTTLQDALRRQMSTPCFPVPFDSLAADMKFETIRDSDDLVRGPFYIRTRSLAHPQGSLGFRIEANGRKLCFATDTEHPAQGFDERLLDLADGVDVLIYDAQYTVDEYEGRNGPSRRGWGHSTYEAATEIARAAGVDRLYLFHHDPEHSDTMIEAIERAAQARFASTWAAREGMTVDV
ncbi:MAG: MBL fold metallo-hydrolase [Myxococcota bacterium]